MQKVIMFKYVFEIYLSLPSEGFHFNYRNRSVFINTEVIKGNLLQSYNRDNYNWLNKKDSHIYKFSVDNNQGVMQDARFIRFDNEKGIYSGGVIEPTHYTQICVFSLLKGNEYSLDEGVITELKSYFFDTIKYFINNYRRVLNENDVPKINISNCPVIEIQTSDNCVISNDGIEGDFKIFKYDFELSGIPKVFEKRVPERDQLDTFNALLKSGQEISMHEMLLLDAKENGQIYGRYDISIIQIGTALEIFLKNLLIYECNRRSITELAGRGKNGKPKFYLTAIYEGSIKDDLFRFFYDIFKKNIKGSKTYNDWHVNAYELRNKIVHNAYQNVTDNDASLAFDSTKELIEEINKIVGGADLS
ncbi:hypothetical protein ACFSCX_06135 [Bacillus salitolerans]|uniref:Apea-like HEPN domain-containing protein n=1 Tax=Bacillus salitolerans TaxID=1437434 RepID=A0ABW4LLU0_9BACI